MKIIFIHMGTILLGLSLLASPAGAQTVDMSTARTVAQNWVTTIIDHKGGWDGSEKAFVAEVSEYKRGDRVIGYYCRIEPSGYILVSLVQGLAPIKAYSTTYELDPYLDEGPADLLKYQLERRLNVIEHELGSLQNVKSADLDRLLEIDHREAWQRLLAGPIPVTEKMGPDEPADDYVEGTTLLSSYWHQFEPYYNLVPAPPPGSPCTEPHCTVGCGALSIAQIMRYWNWPPGRDWPNMPDAMNVNPTQPEIDAVAALCRDVGAALNVTYCSDTCATSSYAIDAEDVFEAGHYSLACAYTHRRDWDANTWWAYIKDNINQNRPLDYSIKGHAIVCDGWQNINGPEYHMNYGWRNTSANTWYFLDDLLQVDTTAGPENEAMTHKIVPKCALGASISGEFVDNPSYPHRYVDRDCSAGATHFRAGQLIHFHPRRVMTCTSGLLQFDGTPAKNTRLYTADYGRGILINDGRIQMYEGASIMFGLQRTD